MALAIKSDISVSRIVGSARSASADSTGLFMKMDWPRSPCANLPSHDRYWIAMGWSSPSCVRSAAMSCWLACGPSITAAGSPGVTRMMTNTMVATMNITATSPTSRFKR
ncbi:hypothetical protein G6F23_015544 [Rhizopus arrhizus]|nr:hypothetical protein G6F23_015544 [Rhizopus arrhizus]